MSVALFDRDAMARWYANEHFKTDPGLRAIYYLPEGAPDREIRLIEVNDLIAERRDDTLEPIDFGVDVGSDSEHYLDVLDVTPAQWERIRKCDASLPLPHGWSLDNAELLHQV